MPQDLRDKVMVITGASSGIGAATAVACAEAGLDLVLGARRGDRLAAVADRVRACGRRVEIVVGDVADPGTSERMLDTARERFGGFDVVFANAGYKMDKLIIEHSDDELRRVFDVNFFAAVELIQIAARRLVDEERAGHLLMCSSCIAKFSLPRQGLYAATKAAQNALCRSMRLEHRDDGIEISSVLPITTTTELFAVSARLSGRTRSVDEPPDHAPPMFVQRPERVANAVVRCLRRPRPEVWTSTIVRTVAAAMTLSPRFGDWVIARQTRSEMAAHRARADDEGAAVEGPASVPAAVPTPSSSPSPSPSPITTARG